ncbi:MAG TPA: trehalose-phosphatase, partial [Xanthomonadaceae bacterium]|nr:trehalose-phosphatase [Xanthomonadaceae bacterium]
RAPQAAGALRAFAEAALPRLPGYRLQHGDHVVELRPAAGDKGEAILAMLDEPPFRGRTPVFAGDDVTDEAGFAVVNARHGLSVLVGAREPSAAHYALPDPGAVRAWLAGDDEETR